MSVFIVTELLLLRSNVHSNLNGLTYVSDRSIQFEGPLRLLRDVIGLTHQIINKLVCQWI